MIDFCRSVDWCSPAPAWKTTSPTMRRKDKHSLFNFRWEARELHDQINPGSRHQRIGVHKVSQLESNIAATEIRMTFEQTHRLDAASTPAPGFTSSLAQPFIRRMIFGGHGLAGWGE